MLINYKDEYYSDHVIKNFGYIEWSKRQLDDDTTYLAISGEFHLRIIKFKEWRNWLISDFRSESFYEIQEGLRRKYIWNGP